MISWQHQEGHFNFANLGLQCSRSVGFLLLFAVSEKYSYTAQVAENVFEMHLILMCGIVIPSNKCEPEHSPGILSIEP